jgi:hypothetical protein
MTWDGCDALLKVHLNFVAVLSEKLGLLRMASSLEKFVISSLLFRRREIRLPGTIRVVRSRSMLHVRRKAPSEILGGNE